MARSVRFTKMHGAGNDYIYVDTQKYHIPDPAKASIAWSKYHTGIGSDGLVLIGKPYDGADADFSMRIFNADGSEAMMCGNASRCIGKYLYEKGLTDKTSIRLQTLSGIKTLNLHLADDNAPTADCDKMPESRIYNNARQVESVTVDMLAPVFHNPQQYDETAGDELTADFRTFRGTFVSMGNPHFVCFVDDIQSLNIARYGSIMEHDSAFPERCNIEFAQAMPDGSLRCRVWERGSGITMACGTGACATAVAAALTNRSTRKSDIVMDGGTLHIEWNEQDGHVYMTGPAEFAFEGEVLLPDTPQPTRNS